MKKNFNLSCLHIQLVEIYKHTTQDNGTNVDRPTTTTDWNHSLIIYAGTLSRFSAKR